MGRRWDAEVRRSREEPNDFARDLFDGLPARYDALEELLSFGQNRRWRRAMVDAVADGRPRTVLDVATGTAGVALMLAGSTDADITGVDLTEQMLRRGQTGSSRPENGGCASPWRGPSSCRSPTRRSTRSPSPTSSATSPTRPRPCASSPGSVRPGGAVASLEFAVPRRPVWLPAWRLYTRVVLPAAGYLTGGREWAHVGRFLGPSIEDHYRRYPVERHVAMWHEAGFDDVRTRTMSLGGGLVMRGRRTSG